MTNSMSNFMIYAGVHFKTCPIEYREIWNLVSDAKIVQEKILHITKQNLEFVNIATCNRFDLCIFGNITQSQIVEIFNSLAQLYLQTNHVHLSENSNFSSFLNIYFDAQALTHLYKVTASLDSLVLGEQQILGQMKSAFRYCEKLGYARKTAHSIFSQNFRVAKKIRFETDIGKNSVSIGHAVIDMTHKVFESFSDKKILIIGAGNMAKIVAQNFFAHGVKSVFMANRTLNKIESLSFDVGFVIPQDLPSSLLHIHEYDICVLAAAGNQFIITEEILKNFAKKRQGKLTIFIDISVPRKITPIANNIENVFLFYIDDLDKIMEQNRSLRKKSAQQAELIICNEVQNFMELCEQKNNLLHVGKMHRWLQKTIHYEVERYLFNKSRGKKTDHEVIAKAIAKRIVSQPALLAKTNKKIENAPTTVGGMLQYLFNISEQQDLEFKKVKDISNVISLKQKQEKLS